MKSLRAQLTLRLLIGGALLLVAVGGLLQWQMRRALTAEFDVSLVAMLNTMTMLVEQKRGHVSSRSRTVHLPIFVTLWGNGHSRRDADRCLVG